MIDNTSTKEELLTPEFLRKIERLNLLAKKVFPGQLKGERRSTKRGASVEFADYRNYSTGDDFRRVDWNVYARLEKLFLKLFVEEEDLHVYLLLDASKSMSFGDISKLLYAKRIAAALSYIALSNLDRVGIAAMDGGKSDIIRPKRGKQSSMAIFEHLSRIDASNYTHLANSLRDFSLKTNQPGLAIIISDFFDEDYQIGIKALLSRKFEVMLIQILDVEEVNPTIVGDLALIDSESGDRKEITITHGLLKKYKEALANHCKSVEDFCHNHGINYVRITNQTPFEELILTYLRQRGAIK